MAIILDEENKVITVENQPDAPRAMFKNLPEASTIEGGVGDVLINGVSIVDEHGNANIPPAGTEQQGVVLVNGDGLQVMSTGRLRVTSPTSARIKEGTQLYQPVDINHQHEAMFYGMAKAAGDATQALSDNEVGTYTEAAKKAIKEMLGIPEWIYSDYKLIYNEEIEDSEVIIIDADLDGNPLTLKAIFVLAECPAAQAASSGIAVNVYDNNVMQGTGYINTAASTTDKKRGFCIIDARNGLWKTEMAAFGTSGLITLQTYTKDINVYGGSIDKIRLQGCIPGYTIKVYGL